MDNKAKDNKNEEIMDERAIRQKKFIRAAALTGVVLLVGMYIVSIVAALCKSESAKPIFMISMYCTFVVPVIIYVLQLIYKLANKKNEEKK